MPLWRSSWGARAIGHRPPDSPGGSGQGPDDLPAEGKKVGRSAGGDEVVVDHHVFVNIGCPCVDEVVCDGGYTGGPASGENAGRNENPSCVTDRRDHLSSGVHIADKGGHILHLAHPIRCRSAGDDDGVKIAHRSFTCGDIPPDGVAFSVGELLLAARTNDGDVRPRSRRPRRGYQRSSPWSLSSVRIMAHGKFLWICRRMSCFLASCTRLIYA